MPSPVPKHPSERRRRNQPPTPDRVLPRDGRDGPAPKCPMPLSKDGRSLWRWLWSTPQAVHWSPEAYAYPLAMFCHAFEEWSEAAACSCTECGHDKARNALWKVIEGYLDRFLLNPKTLTSAHMWLSEPGEPPSTEKVGENVVTSHRFKAAAGE